MEMTPPDVAISIDNATDVAEARRVATEILRDGRRGKDLDVGRYESCALVVTELGTNLIKHAGGGTLILRSMSTTGLEVISLDAGPGMEDPQRCFEDGYSLGGTMGAGLGAVGRLSSYQVYSVPGQGTALLARIGEADKAEDLGAISVPYPGETVCGDTWSVIKEGNRLQVVIADGLGHGPEAAKASVLAIAIAGERAFDPPDRLIREMHPALRQTRGVAISIASLDLTEMTVEFAGVGNVAGSLTSSSLKTQRMASMNGTAGLEIPRIQPFRYKSEVGSLLILHSDGLSARWSLDQYPQLHSADPTVIAGVLFRDHRRMHDDATVVVVRL